MPATSSTIAFAVAMSKDYSTELANEQKSKEQKEEGLQSTEELQPVSSSEKKGTVAGAMAFIIGTSIGSGILAIPEKASPAVTFFFSSNISQL
ncbi:tyrosine-specific transport protein 1-like isoform X3 [Cucumis melo var. makuwa]|uniref:Tyrosine-specific transport protein 1-like isoform X3 n=1 Tax=Cucumis melo var. makuwa TaxID=1194695 RepID=A0A5A7T0X3_CUCMM|nr:tyrosine-specific transport protein 1-like isoform X3 [Cucumis melo var. makuwa]